MKFGIFLIVSLILALTISAVGCGNGGQTLGRDGMKLINEDALGGAYFRVDVARGDGDLAQIYESLCEEIFDDEELSDLGIDTSQIDYFAVQNQGGDEVAVAVLGRFDLDSVRDGLTELGLTRGEYDGIEFWSGYYSIYGQTGMAIFENGFVWGDEQAAKSITHTVNGSDRSLYEVAAVREVLDRLPKWTPLFVMVSLDPLSDMDIPDAEALSAAAAKKDADLMKVCMVVKFMDEADAQEMCEYIQGQQNMSAKCDGKFAILEGEVPIEDWEGW